MFFLDLNFTLFLSPLSIFIYLFIFLLIKISDRVIDLNYIHIRSDFYHEITPNILYFEYKVNRIHLESSYCVCLVLTCRKWRKMKKTEEKCPLQTHGLRYGRTKYLDGFLDARQWKKGIISFSSKSVQPHGYRCSRTDLDAAANSTGKVRAQYGRTVAAVRMLVRMLL